MVSVQVRMHPVKCALRPTSVIDLGTHGIKVDESYGRSYLESMASLKRGNDAQKSLRLGGMSSMKLKTPKQAQLLVSQLRI